MTDSPLDIYCIAIGGTGMAPLAALLQARGHRVRGVDGPLYPPMSTLLDRCGIPRHVGFDPAHLDPPPDLVVIGNVVARGNPEAQEAERLGLPCVSMPQAIARFFLAGRKPLVVSGTHGKTTTTSMAAWVYRECGADPGFLVGGLPHGLETSFAEGSGERFIIEGDEYNAAYFDRGPKFLHYAPETLILTGVEYDHADLYPSPEALLAAYEQLIALLPERGLLAACGDRPAVRELAAASPAPVRFYGLDAGNDVRPAAPPEATAAGMRFTIEDPEAGPVEIRLALWGDHNVENALGVWTAARADGLPADRVADALARFAGVRRRLDILGEVGEVVVIDDFAHHPTAVGKSLAALAAHYPDRRRVAIFEPRSLTAGRKLFQAAYRRAFREADRVLLAPIFHAGRLAEEERIDLAELADELTHDGVSATAYPSTEAVFEAALAEAGPGDVLVTMSSGAFDGMPHRLFEALSDR